VYITTTCSTGPKTITYPDAGTSVLYSYQGAYLASVCNEVTTASACGSDQVNFITGVTYDDETGRPEVFEMHPGTLRYTYEPVERRLQQIRFDRTSGNKDLELTYGYDKVGNVTPGRRHAPWVRGDGDREIRIRPAQPPRELRARGLAHPVLLLRRPRQPDRAVDHSPRRAEPALHPPDQAACAPQRRGRGHP
jgi:hypothetical protein